MRHRSEYEGGCLTGQHAHESPHHGYSTQPETCVLHHEPDMIPYLEGFENVFHNETRVSGGKGYE